MDPTYRIQSNSGTVDPAATSFTATLPAGTQDGSTLLLFFATTGAPTTPSADPPWAVDEAHAANEFVFRRANQPAGETSWTVSYVVAVRWAWYIEEWAAMSSVAQPDSSANNASSPPVPVITVGSQANNTALAQQPCSPDVTDYRAVAMFRQGGSAGGGVFPAGHSYDAGWSEIAALTVGTGTATSDFMLLAAEAYPGTTGTIDCTLTWDTTGGGTYTDKTVDAWVAAYQPAATVPFGVLTA
jgi:hypothetical protein